MHRILAFGGGLQTSAVAILVRQGRVPIDEAVFVDTGCEKPETYWYIEHYIRALFKEAGKPFTIIPGTDARGYLYEKCLHYRNIPMYTGLSKWCTDKHKVVPLRRYARSKGYRKGEYITLIGFSVDEAKRCDKDTHRAARSEFPLIQLGMSADDCRRVISDYGYPRPLKSSCYICPYQRWQEWNWLKAYHPELVEKALVLERAYHERRPDFKEIYGLFGGKPLWKFAEGRQAEFGFPEEYSCYSGHCGH